MSALRKWSRVREIGTPDELASFVYSLRGELLAFANHHYPQVDAEEVIQDLVPRLLMDPSVYGDPDHVRRCLFHRFLLRLSDRHRLKGGVELVADSEPHLRALEQTPDPDESADPAMVGMRGWYRDVVEDLLAPYSAEERIVIRMRYRGQERARRNDGVVSRKDCAAMLGWDVARVRSIEDRVMRQVEEQIAAYDTTCERREEEVRLACRLGGRRAARRGASRPR